jgi:hypothetical protein
MEREEKISDREAMTSALKKVVQPFLRSSEFKGSFPHYRRAGTATVDLLTFQFNRHGSSFVIEVARCPADGIITPWGARIPPEKATAGDIHPNYRPRLQPTADNAVDQWFRFGAESAEEVAAAVLRRLTEQDPWSQLPIGHSKPQPAETAST